MKENEEIVDIRNAELKLRYLREDTLREAAILTDLIEGRDKIRADIAELEEVKKAELALIASERGVLEEERELLKQQREDALKAILRAKEEFKVVDRQLRDAMNELGRVNSWIFTAEETKGQLKTETADLSEKKSEKAQLLLDINEALNKLDEAKEAATAINLECQLLLDETNEKVKKIELSATEAEERLKIAEIAREKAELDLFDLKSQVKTTLT